MHTPVWNPLRTCTSIFNVAATTLASSLAGLLADVGRGRSRVLHVLAWVLALLARFLAFGVAAAAAVVLLCKCAGAAAEGAVAGLEAGEPSHRAQERERGAHDEYVQLKEAEEVLRCVVCAERIESDF